MGDGGKGEGEGERGRGWVIEELYGGWDGFTSIGR